MNSCAHKSKVLLGGVCWGRSILLLVFHKLNWVNVNSVPLAAVQEEGHFFWSLSLNSDCFPIEPKKINLCSKCPWRQENALCALLVNISIWWKKRKKINTFFLKRVTARGESSLSLSDWWNCIKVSYPPLSSIFILVTLQSAGVQCSASTSITILSPKLRAFGKLRELESFIKINVWKGHMGDLNKYKF